MTARHVSVTHAVCSLCNRTFSKPEVEGGAILLGSSHENEYQFGENAGTFTAVASLTDRLTCGGLLINSGSAHPSEKFLRSSDSAGGHRCSSSLRDPAQVKPIR
ncbi:hypothetical protein JZ751_028727 [Albula glossodonta]|uniref:Uncharacterized protein n=1 Tax=Albula glossodonta TaxID=121402 RepID=A0A8T2NC77_9TELE|nr:hypothetical protein JZ751_028727 [Albula glossodonta]